MKIIVQLISQNSETPVFTVDTSKLSSVLAQGLIASISSGEMFSSRSSNYSELTDAIDKTPFPYQIDGIVEVIFD